jgi:RNA-directed DNA polymerase
MNERGKSDGCVVPAKPANNTATAVAELVEERHPAKGNTDGETHPGRRAGNGVSRDLDRVREVAVRDKQVRFTALSTTSPSIGSGGRTGRLAPRLHRGPMG